MPKKRRLAYWALIVNVIVWGLAAPIVKPALSYISPVEFLFYRFLIAGVVALPFTLWLMAKNRPGISNLIRIAGLELIGTTIILWLIYVSLSLTSVVEASLIYSASPLFVTLAGIIFLGEKQTKSEWAGFSLAFLGTVIIALSPIVSVGKFSVGGGSLKGNLLMLAQNILWAGYLVAAKKWYRKIPKLTVTGIGFWVGLISFFILAQPNGSPWLNFLADMRLGPVFFAVVYMAIMGSIVGATTYLFAQNIIEISEASIFTYGQALIALPAAYIWLNEAPSPAALIGAGLAGIGVYIAKR